MAKVPTLSVVDVRQSPTVTVGTVRLVDGALVVDGPAWLRRAAKKPAGFILEMVQPEPTVKYLRALQRQLSGSALRATLERR